MEGISLNTISYLINLDVAVDRLDYALPAIEALDFPVQRVSAVHGKDLPSSVIEEKVDHESYKVRIGLHPGPGTIGCSLSHIKTWETFLESTFEYALIFEDDVIFEPRELHATVIELAKCPGLWDICLFSKHHSGNPLSLKHFKHTNNDLCVYLSKVTQSGAYLLNRKAAMNLLASALPINLPVDHYFTRGWELGLKFTGVEPRIADQSSFGDSYISRPPSVFDDPGGVNALFKIKRKYFLTQTKISRAFFGLIFYLRTKLMNLA